MGDHETGLSGNVVASFFPLKIFIPLCFNVLSTVPRENRLTDSLYIYIYREREREREREVLRKTQHWTTSGGNCNCPERDLNPRPPDH